MKFMRGIVEEPTRTETIKVSFALDSAAAMRHAEDIQRVVGDMPNLANIATIEIDYKFNAAYFGEVEEKLEAINRLLQDDSIVRYASVSELLHGRSIIWSVAEKLTRIIDKLEESE